MYEGLKQHVGNTYHSRDLAHLGKLMTKATGCIFLDVTRKVDASPVVNSTSIDYFLYDEGKQCSISIILRMLM